MGAAMRGFQESEELMVGCMVLFAQLSKSWILEELGLAASAIAVCSPLLHSM